MTDHTSIDIKRPRLRRYHVDAKGHQHLGGRWSKERIRILLIENYNKKFSLDELARFVYGTTSPRYRDNVRKHIPTQRNYMLARMTPFVTHYGARGLIQSVKLYRQDEEQDRLNLTEELDRLLLRGELTRDRYEKIAELLRLPPPTLVPTAS
jgi:hypothetical protein